MKELNELIHKALETKLEDGSFDQILSDYIDGALRKLLDGMFERSWNPSKEPHGEAYAYVEETVRPLVMQSLEECDLTAVAKKTKLAMNAIIEECSIAQIGKSISDVLGIFGKSEELKYEQRYSMKSILEAYVKMIERRSYVYDTGWFADHGFDLDDGYACLECAMDVEDIESSSGREINSKKLVTLHLETLDDDDMDNVFIQFTIFKDYMDHWKVDYKALEPIGFAEIEHMNSVELLLRQLSSNCCVLTDVDDEIESAEFHNLY